MTTHRASALAFTLILGIGALGCRKKEPEYVEPAKPVPTQVTVVHEHDTGDAHLEGDRITIARPIYYDTDKDLIRPESFSVIDAVATVIKNHPEIKMVIVEGHTDNQGNFDHNRGLSERRANAVVQALVLRGVSTPTQIAGYGATNNICSTPDENCLQLNRRVEFRIKRD